MSDLKWVYSYYKNGGTNIKDKNKIKNYILVISSRRCYLLL